MKLKCPDPAPFHTDLVVILVRTQMAENIGSAARAMMNFGVDELRLVDPRPFDQSQAESMACAASPIIKKAKTFPDLSSALEDCHFSIATTRRPRRARFPLLSPKEVFSMDSIKNLKKIALVFGPERTGLTNEEVYLCDSASSVPTTESGSMNIAQSVVVYLYEWFLAQKEKSITVQQTNPDDRPITQKEKEVTFNLMHEILEKSEYHPKVRLPDFISNLKHLFEHRPLNLWEYKTLVKALRYVLKKMDRKTGKD